MLRSWYPISPELDDKGAFVALRHLPNGAQCVPVPLDAGQQPFGTLLIDGSSFSASLAATLGVAAVAQGTIDAKAQYVHYDAVLYSEATTNAPLGGVVYGTRWGAGLRFSLTITQLQTDVSVNTPILAGIAVELGLANVFYEIECLGMPAADLLALAPAPGRLTFDSAKTILAAVGDVRDTLPDLKDAGKLVQLPIAVQLAKSPTADLLADSRAVLFAMNQIKAGARLSAALSLAVKSGLDEYPIRTTYQLAVADQTADPTPSQAEATLAAKWVDIGW